MTDQPVPVLCPNCKVLKSCQPITVRRTVEGTEHRIFSGCVDCLAALIEEWQLSQGPICNICGEKKVETMYTMGSKRMSCPIHTQGKGLLVRSMQALGPAHPLTKEIVEALGLA